MDGPSASPPEALSTLQTIAETRTSEDTIHPILDSFYNKVADLKDLEEELNAYIRDHLEVLHDRTLIEDRGESLSVSAEDFAAQFFRQRGQYEAQLVNLADEIRALGEHCKEAGLEIKAYRDNLEQSPDSDSHDAAVHKVPVSLLDDGQETFLANLDNRPHDSIFTNGLSVEHISFDRVMNVTPPPKQTQSQAHALQAWVDNSGQSAL